MDDNQRLLKEFTEGLKGLDFPTSRSAIVNKLKDIGGLNGEVNVIAEQLPDRTYDWERDAVREFEGLQNEGAGLDGGLAAAPSALDNADKGLVETMADPRRGETG